MNSLITISICLFQTSGYIDCYPYKLKLWKKMENQNKLPKLKNKNRKENEYTNQKFEKQLKIKRLKKKAYKLCLHVLDSVKPQLPVCFIKAFKKFTRFRFSSSKATFPSFLEKNIHTPNPAPVKQQPPISLKKTLLIQIHLFQKIFAVPDSTSVKQQPPIPFRKAFMLQIPFQLNNCFQNNNNNQIKTEKTKLDSLTFSSSRTTSSSFLQKSSYTSNLASVERQFPISLKSSHVSDSDLVEQQLPICSKRTSYPNFKNPVKQHLPTLLRRVSVLPCFGFSCSKDTFPSLLQKSLNAPDSVPVE
uniref:Uncharacterized protein n=2 Tax=Strongyloides stercoralis TaxID=6248 RepID=A0AAF5DMC4_STRER